MPGRDPPLTHYLTTPRPAFRGAGGLYWRQPTAWPHSETSNPLPSIVGRHNCQPKAHADFTYGAPAVVFVIRLYRLLCSWQIATWFECRTGANFTHLQPRLPNRLSDSFPTPIEPLHALDKSLILLVRYRFRSPSAQRLGRTHDLTAKPTVPTRQLTGEKLPVPRPQRAGPGQPVFGAPGLLWRERIKTASSHPPGLGSDRVSRAMPLNGYSRAPSGYIRILFLYNRSGYTRPV